MKTEMGSSGCHKECTTCTELKDLGRKTATLGATGFQKYDLELSKRGRFTAGPGSAFPGEGKGEGPEVERKSYS